MPRPEDDVEAPLSGPGPVRARRCVVGLLVVASMVACGSPKLDESVRAGPATAADTGSRTADVADQDESSPRRGGTARIATTGEPPHLDPSRSTDTLVLLIGGHVYETLFTSDAEHRPVPLLAAGHDVSEDGLRHTVTLRRDVRFHDGQPLTAPDVIASIERWMDNSGLGAGLLEATDELIAIDDHTVEFRLLEPFGVLTTALSRQLQAATIHPASVVERSDRTRLAAPIGTGPYELAEWLPGRHIRLERFDAYRPPSGTSDGYAGAKAQYLDAIEFVPMPEEASRVAAIRSGDVHHLEAVSPDQLDVLRRDDDLAIEVAPADVWLNLVLNLRSPSLAETEIRRAIQLALDHDEILRAAVGEGYYALGPDLLPGIADWSSDAGADRYDQRDPEAARHLLLANDAQSTPLRLMTSLEQRSEYNAALVIEQQLEAVGFAVQLEVLDGATLSGRRSKEDQWELYLASASFRPDPIMRNLTRDATGWWDDPAKEALLDELRGSIDPDQRHQIWREVQHRFHEEVPRIKIGDLRRVVVHRSELHGLGPTTLQPDLSNAWLAP